MAEFKTPAKEKRNIVDQLTIPASPLMKCLGYGTGVSVYKLNRSPICSQIRSPWAIKKIMKSKSTKLLRKRLVDEAAVLKKLDHPNIIGYRTFTKDNHGKMCLVMEACTTSLGDMIEERNENGLLAFPPSNIAKYSNDIAKALDYLHNKASILHCDIKSYNILIQGDFEICKLCDFGIALPIQSDGVVDSKLLAESCLGTGPWMAPEVVLDSIASTKSDIYSYGLVIWEMIALTIPPQNDEVEENCLEMSGLDNSTHSLKSIDWRPELPSQELSKDYDYVLELFYCCTMKESQYRPNADILVKVTTEILKELS